MPNDRVTCLIPTYNRPEFLRRLLTYMHTVQPQWELWIADSSNPVHRAANEAVVSDFESSLRLNYRHLDMPLFDKCQLAFSQIQTPFIVLCADDDFVSPRSVDDCVEFLDTHPDYSVCQGVSLIVEKRPERLKTKVELGWNVDSDDVCERLRGYAQNWYAPFYGVYRTGGLAGIFESMAEFTCVDRCRILAEFLHSFLALTDGKLHVLPTFYAARQSHPTNACAIAPPSTSTDDFNALTVPFSNCLRRAIWKTPGVSLSDADATISVCVTAAANSVLQWGRPKPTRLGRIAQELLRPLRQLAEWYSQGARHRTSRTLPLTDLFQHPDFCLAASLIEQFPAGIPQAEPQRKAA